MNAKAYILLDIINGKSQEVAECLSGRPGVVGLELLEGSPGMLVKCEANNRQALARLTVDALAAVEHAIENVSLLPVKVGVRNGMN